MTTITGNQINLFQLLVWKGALRLEILGMTRRGRSACNIVKDHFDIPKETSKVDTLAILLGKIEEMKKEIEQ